MVKRLIRCIKGIQKKYYKRQIISTALSIKGEIVVNGLSYVNRNTRIGHNVHFNGLRIIGKGQVEIGDNFHSGMDCVIIPDVHNYNGDTLPYDDKIISKPVIIEDNVWLGHGVIILGGVTIGEGAIIQAGSVVVKSIPKLGIAGGNPAKVFKERNSTHYYELKSKSRFM